MKNSFVIPKVNSTMPSYAVYNPLYDIDSMKFRTSEHEKIFVAKAHAKFRQYFEDNGINVDEYVTSSKHIGPFTVWEHIYKYKLSDFSIHNILGYTIHGLSNFDLDFTFDTSEYAKMFYEKIKDTLTKYNLPQFVNDSLKVNGPIVSKSCVDKISAGQLVAWCATLTDFMKDTKSSLMVELNVTPGSQWWGKETKRDWIVGDNNGDMWVFSNCEYIAK